MISRFRVLAGILTCAACFIAILSVATISCSDRSSKMLLDLGVIQIDIHSAEKCDFTEIIDTLFHVVKLETTQNSLIGEIDKLEISNNYIYITDDMAKSVFRFDMSGNFISKVNAYGRGPGEYLSITASTVLDSTIFIVDNLSYKQLEYCITGKFIRETKLLDKIWANDIFNYNNKIYYVNDWSETEVGNYRLFSYDPLSEKIESYLPFEDVPLSLGINGPRYAVHSEGFSVIYSGIDEIYALLPDDNVSPIYAIDFMNEKAVYNSNNPVAVLTENRAGKVLGINRIFETDKYLFLYTYHVGGNENLFIFNKNDNIVTFCESCNHNFFDDIACRIKIASDNKIINWFEAYFFKLLYKHNWSSNVSMLPTMLQRLSQIDQELKDEDNPVLFIYNLK